MQQEASHQSFEQQRLPCREAGAGHIEPQRAWASLQLLSEGRWAPAVAFRTDEQDLPSVLRLGYSRAGGEALTILMTRLDLLVETPLASKMNL